MRPMTQLFVGVLFLGFGTQQAWASGAADGIASSTGDASVLSAAYQLADAVRTRDVSAFLRLVAREGVPCIDSIVSRQELEKQLRARDTWLGAYFFAPEVFREKFADLARPISFAEFLATARDLRVTTRATKDERYPCVRFSASNVKSRPYFCFQRNSDRWVLRELPNCG